VFSQRLSMGGIALGLILIAGFTLVSGFRGVSIGEYLAARDLVAGTVYYLLLSLLAVMPLLVCRNQEYLTAANRDAL